MRRLILSALLAAFFWCARLSGATGDITLTVRPDGWTASLSVEGFTTGATYAFGLTGNNVPTSTTPYLTVVSEGYDNTGTLGTVTRIVWLQPRSTASIVRFPFGTVYLTGTYNAGTFVDGETVTQAVSGATGIIVGNQAAGARLYFKSVTGTFDNTNQITGGTSGATFTSSSTITTPTVPTNDEKDTGSALVALVALSDYVYVDDNTGAGKSGTAPTFTAPANFIVNSGGGAQNSTASTNAAVTQSSTVVYPKVVANWSWPGFQLMTSASKLRAVAFHRSAQSGRPVRAVKFSVTDGSTTNTETLTAPVYDSTVGDAVPVVEYVTTDNLVSGLTQGANLTCNFIAYPWIGDAAAILDTSAGTVQPTPVYGPISAVCNNTGTYGIAFAVVDSVGGSDPASVSDDTGKWVGAGSDPGSGAGVTAYATLARAARAVRNYNNTNHSRDDVAGYVYAKAGNYAWLGATISGGYGSVPKTWITIKPFTSVARADVVINAASGNLDISDLIKIEGVTINTAANTNLSSVVHSWFDQCHITSSGTTLVSTSPACVWYTTRCVVAQLAQGFRPFSTQNASPALIRGNDLTGFAAGIFTYTVVGNLKTGTSKPLVTSILSGQTIPVSDNAIFAFNKFLGVGTAANHFLQLNHAATTHGVAIVQNLIEVMEGAALLWNTPEPSISPSTHVIVWHNTLVGQRGQVGYNDTGSVTKLRDQWSQKNNYWDRWANKVDIFPTANGMRVGAWPVTFGVGNSGNVYAQNMEAIGDFYAEFVGIQSHQPTSPSGESSTYAQFTNLKARTASGDGAGGGTYTTTPSSPLRGMQRDWVLPYDIAGNPRTATSDAGAYAPTGSTKVGGSGTTKVGGSGTVKVQAR